jgi:hemerythrin-like domain-containing protein
MMNSGVARRRGFVAAAGATGLALVTRAALAAGVVPTSEAVSPVEDLAREHGVLQRLFLVYEAIAHRVEGGDALPEEVLASAAGLVRHFIEEYHEEMEETFVFPRFEALDPYREVVTVLHAQHDAGRLLTDDILSLASPHALDTAAAKMRLVADIHAYLRMYRPHAAREDTVIFPGLRALLGERVYAELGDSLEEEEHRRFGAHGFEDAVAQVARLEHLLGIYDLAQFTP